MDSQGEAVTDQKRAAVRYRTIVADPPWHYDNHATMPGNAKKQGHVTKRQSLPYSTMTVAAIRELPVVTLAEADCRLFLWTTNLYLPESFSVVSAWGFTYKQTLVWHKTGNPSPFGGSVAPNHAEFLLVADRGSPAIPSRLSGSVIAAPKPYEHSKKPEGFLDLIETCSPPPFLEMFARYPRLGWDTWGDEALNHVELAG
jgi:N6-adenosine-specific RNA methylase IME4